MINVNDIEKLKELFERTNELPVKDLYAAKEILNELLGVAKRNPEINIMDEYDSLLSQFEDGENKHNEWKLAKRNLAENIELIIDSQY